MVILCMIRAVPEFFEYPIFFSMMGGLFWQDRRLSSRYTICGERDIFVYIKIPFDFRV